MNCRICKSPTLIPILNLGTQYLSEFREDGIRPPKFPLELTICAKCRQVQLKDTVPQNLLYSDNYGYRSGINSTMRNHLKDLMFETLSISDAVPGSLVVDIGSNDGTLLKSYPKNLRRVGFDLITKFHEYYKDSGIKFYDEPFSVSRLKTKAKIVTMISMFYDLDDPVSLLREVKECLDKKGIIVIQQNYLLEMIRKNGFDNITYEHLMYHSLTSMERLLKPLDLEVFNVSINELNGGSIRTYIANRGEYHICDRVYAQREAESDLADLPTYYNFKNRINDLTFKLWRKLVLLSQSGKRVYLYGASTRINTLLQYTRINTTHVQKAVERNPEKYGKKISSVGIPIISEEQARLENPDYYLIGIWHFREETEKRLASYVNNGGRLIFPLPEIEVVGGTKTP